jgi:hypothetical protein
MVYGRPVVGRLVVLGNGSPTEEISHFVDHSLNPTIPNIRSYVKDTTHFLKIIEDLGDDSEKE